MKRIQIPFRFTRRLLTLREDLFCLFLCESTLDCSRTSWWLNSCLHSSLQTLNCPLILRPEFVRKIDERRRHVFEKKGEEKYDSQVKKDLFRQNEDLKEGQQHEKSECLDVTHYTLSLTSMTLHTTWKERKERKETRGRVSLRVSCRPLLLSRRLWCLLPILPSSSSFLFFTFSSNGCWPNACKCSSSLFMSRCLHDCFHPLWRKSLILSVFLSVVHDFLFSSTHGDIQSITRREEKRDKRHSANKK